MYHNKEGWNFQTKIHVSVKKKLYFVMVTMSRLNRDFQWAIRDKQSLLSARFLHIIMKHAWSGNHAKADVLTTTLPHLSQSKKYPYNGGRSI